MDVSPGAAVLLGLLQGLTEFLPVSSSGHLVIGQALLGMQEPALTFDVWLHLATLLVVMAFYRRDIMAVIRDLPAASGATLRGDPTPWRDPQRPARLGLLIVVASIPTGLIGVLGKDLFERLFSSTSVVGVALLVTAALLAATRIARRGGTPKSMLWWHALAIGLAQGLAITPGISRSGSTIAVALLLGLGSEDSARFSFMCSIPAILGALLLQLLKIDPASLARSDILVSYGLGFAAAALSGWMALGLLVRLVRSGRFHWFSPYLVVAGIATLIFVR